MRRRVTFADRAEAGRLLAERLAASRLQDPLVLALPRGGVPVGAEIARALGAPLDVAFVRKISYGEGVERVFPLYSPMIDSIKVVRRGKVRRAKLYYLRGRRGKSARITEKQDHRPADEGGAAADKAAE